MTNLEIINASLDLYEKNEMNKFILKFKKMFKNNARKKRMIFFVIQSFLKSS